MIAVIPIPASFSEKIAHWPPYPDPYEVLDYALRAGVGWLDTYGRKPGCIRLGGYSLGELVGFSLLVPDAPEESEFFIAIHPLHLHEGRGGQITRRTLEYGFHHEKLQEIHLKVRKNHEVGIHTYSKYGFSISGELAEVTNGIMTDFFKMTLPLKRFLQIESGVF